MAKTVGDFLGFGLEILFFLCYTTPSDAGLVYRYYSSFPSWLGGFDSRTPLQKSASFDRRLPIFTYSLFTIHSSLKLGPIFGERNCGTAADIEKDLHAWVWRFFVAEN